MIRLYRTASLRELGLRRLGFRRDLVEGFRSGFPACCVLDFSLRWLLGRPRILNPATRRERPWWLPGYIPCGYHVRKLNHRAALAVAREEV